MKIFMSPPGVVCAAGKNFPDFWKSCISGNQDGIEKVASLSGEEFYVARIKDEWLQKSSEKFDTRFARIGETALCQIESHVEKAKKKFGSRRIAVCVGSCDNGSELSLRGHREFFSSGKFPEWYDIEMQGASYAGTFVKKKFLLEGPCISFSTACSSSALAAIKGCQLIKSNLADAVVVGGVDVASDTVLLGFNSLEAVSREITNPFSKNRCGITLGEGASFFVISRENLFENEGVEILGYAETSDAYHMTSPDPSGDGACRAMKKALESASVLPSDIGYVNLHGTGTKLNDSMESDAVKKVFGNHEVPASTTKPITGHTLGASSAMELAVCYGVLVDENANLPVQKWDGMHDDEVQNLLFVGKENHKAQKRVDVCMSNSFAFGGSNACVIIGRCLKNPDGAEIV